MAWVLAAIAVGMFCVGVAVGVLFAALCTEPVYVGEPVEQPSGVQSVRRSPPYDWTQEGLEPRRSPTPRPGRTS